MKDYLSKLAPNPLIDTFIPIQLTSPSLILHQTVKIKAVNDVFFGKRLRVLPVFSASQSSIPAPLFYVRTGHPCPPRPLPWAPGEPPSDWTEWLRRLASATKQLINSGHSVSERAHILSPDEKLPKVRLGRAATAGRCGGTSQGLDKRPPEDPRPSNKKANTETKTEFVTTLQHFTNIVAELIRSDTFNMLLSPINLIHWTLILAGTETPRLTSLSIN